MYRPFGEKAAMDPLNLVSASGSTGDWQIVDLGSTNGIKVNDRRVDRSRLSPGDEVEELVRQARRVRSHEIHRLDRAQGDHPVVSAPVTGKSDALSGPKI